MKSSTVPAPMISSSSSTKELELDYERWTDSFPSAILSFKSITQLAKNKRIALFLDYDGTLSPIVNDPDRAYMSAEMRSALKEVAKYFATSIISGRSRPKVQNFVKLPELYYAGSHGMDIASPSDQGLELYQPDAAGELIEIINQVCRLLAEATEHIPGATVENNKFCLSVHYRNVDEERVEEVENWVVHTITAYPNLQLKRGLKVLEIRPTIPWNKGNAVQYLIESLGMRDVLSIYIGDDKTDEDAFKVLRDQNLGFGILVSSVPKPSLAFYSLRNPDDVMGFLISLVKWKKKYTVV